MAGRRTNGSGSIFENNGKYTAQFRVGKNENGKPRFVKKTFKTKRECNEWLEETRRKYGQLSQSEYSESQICELLQLWFDYKKDRLKPKSLDRIESTINTHVIPMIGSHRLCDITSEGIQRLVFDNMQKKGLSKSSMKKAYDDLNNFFNFCIDSDWLDKSPMRRVSIDNYNCKPEKRVNSFDKEQMTAIVVSSLEQYGNGTPVYECGLIFPVMYLTGMRISEALGLRWRCVDFENGWIDIKETVVSAKDRNSDKKGRQQIVQESGKTRNSLRRIPLSKIICILGRTVTMFGIIITIRFERKKDETARKQQAQPILMLQHRKMDVEQNQNDYKSSYHIDFCSLKGEKLEYDKIELQLPDIILRNVGFNAAINIELFFSIDGMKCCSFSGLDYLPSNEFEAIKIVVELYKQEIEESFENIQYKKNGDSEIIHAYFMNAYTNLKTELHNKIKFVAGKKGSLTIKYQDVYGNEYYHYYGLSLWLVGLNNDMFISYMTYPTYSRKIKPAKRK